MSILDKFRENWVRPALFFGNNLISLVGGAITTAAAVTTIGYWLVELFGRPNDNPYLGIIFFFLMPGLFVFGLVLIPIGIFLQRHKLRKAGQIPTVYPKVDLNDRMFRHGLDIVLVATIVNLLIVATASYRGAAYMDSPQFCGQSCHVMNPEYTAYKVSAHSHVPCVECHIGSGVDSYIKAKVNGSKQLLDVMTGHYETPIPSPVTNLRPAREICEACHTPAKYVGEKLLVKSSFADDEANTQSQTVLVLHLGGEDSFSHLSGIHGVHLNQMKYIATTGDRQTIPWVARRNADGSQTVFTASSLNGATPKGELRTMDCIDCHNRASHTFQTPEEALNRAMADGAISTDLPWIHKEGLELLKATYSSQDEAKAKIPAQLKAFYSAQRPDVLQAKANLVQVAGAQLYTIYARNVFPDMKVTWGTHPNNIGHMAYPGCFRCHDGDHSSKDGKTVTQDCSNCHNLLAVEESKPKVLSDLGITQ
ncbi:cytochrome c3 family protein [Telmatobacter bradus]|uniref:cytochrome c3 family protein n=1 Tax=Telmatobacter bradus TaxID=474953 RepID=UPI003B4298D4